MPYRHSFGACVAFSAFYTTLSATGEMGRRSAGGPRYKWFGTKRGKRRHAGKTMKASPENESPRRLLLANGCIGAFELIMYALSIHFKTIVM